MKRRRKAKALVWLFVLLMMISIAPSSLLGQDAELSEAADSPLWWTLDDVITPERLRLEQHDRSASLERFAMALDKGLVQAPPPEQLSRLTVYWNGRLTPELFSMAKAIQMLAARLEARSISLDQRLETAAALAEFGVSPQGADTILDFLVELDQRVEVWEGLVGNDLIRVAELIRSAPAVVDQQELWEAFENNHAGTLALNTGVPKEEIERLLEHNYDAAARYLRSELPRLKEDLTPKDWAGFRSYLLREVASSMTAIGYEPEGVIND